MNKLNNHLTKSPANCEEILCLIYIRYTIHIGAFLRAPSFGDCSSRCLRLNINEALKDRTGTLVFSVPCYASNGD